MCRLQPGYCIHKNISIGLWLLFFWKNETSMFVVKMRSCAHGNILYSIKEVVYDTFSHGCTCRWQSTAGIKNIEWANDHHICKKRCSQFSGKDQANIFTEKRSYDYVKRFRAVCIEFCRPFVSKLYTLPLWQCRQLSIIHYTASVRNVICDYMTPSILQKVEVPFFENYGTFCFLWKNGLIWLEKSSTIHTGNIVSHHVWKLYTLLLVYRSQGTVLYCYKPGRKSFMIIWHHLFENIEASIYCETADALYLR